MSWPLIPWESCNIPTEIQSEFIRRKTNRSFNYRKSDGWNNTGNNNDWEKYKGPMTSWVRVCSNSNGRLEVKKPGFILSGGKGFYQTYGFKWNQEGNQQILGWTPDGKPHTLDYDKNTSQFPIHVPCPEIVKVETIIQKELFRRAWIHWKCFSPKQLEYMTPYFLVPGVTMTLEFGWNHFNQKSLLDLTDKDKLAEYYFTNPYPLYKNNILQSNGNYDVVFGLVTNFEWSIDGNHISCMTEITSKDRLYSGVPISTIVAEKKDPKNPETEIVYFSNIRKICDTDFIKNLKAISMAESLDSLENTMANVQLYQIIKKGTLEGNQVMKKEYWRGIFFGRDASNMKTDYSSQLDYTWTVPATEDFDKTQNDDNVWVNMGFIVELLNRCLPFPSPKKESGFFHVDVDEAVIGAHPNHISCNGSYVLIPNAAAPKYMWGNEGKKENGVGGDYTKQIGVPSEQNVNSYRTINKKKKDKDDPLWNADYQLTQIFKQGNHPTRDDLDWVINANRYVYAPERWYSFPFITDQTLLIKNRDKEATYDPNFYGYFKDLYFNVKRFIELVKDESIKTYVDLYKAIFDDINKAGGNFWDLALVTNENTSQLIVVDNKMLPSGNNKARPWYFDYMDSDQLMTGLGFKPKMSDAQAFRVVFGETNNSGSRTVSKEENDLLDYRFEDRILEMRKDFQPTVLSDSEGKKDPFLEQVKQLQHQTPINGSYQFTVMVGDKPYFRRLALPIAEMLNCLLDDNDLEKNQRYTGLQPITVEVPLQGIGGLRTFMTFMIRNLPNPYHHKDVAYRIVDVHHTLQDGKWDTTIKAGIIPLRGYIKQKLGIEE